MVKEDFEGMLKRPSRIHARLASESYRIQVRPEPLLEHRFEEIEAGNPDRPQNDSRLGIDAPDLDRAALHEEGIFSGTRSLRQGTGAIGRVRNLVEAGTAPPGFGGLAEERPPGGQVLRLRGRRQRRETVKGVSSPRRQDDLEPGVREIGHDLADFLEVKDSPLRLHLFPGKKKSGVEGLGAARPDLAGSDGSGPLRRRSIQIDIVSEPRPGRLPGWYIPCGGMDPRREAYGQEEDGQDGGQGSTRRRQGRAIPPAVAGVERYQTGWSESNLL